MYPHERSLVKNLAGKPFALIGVNSDQQLSTPQKLVADGIVTWRSFQNGPRGNDIATAFGVKGWPSIYLIDAKGVVRYVNPQREGKLDEALAELLKEVDVDLDIEKVLADAKEERNKVATNSGPQGTAKPPAEMSEADKKRLEKYQKRQMERAKKQAGGSN